MTRLMIAGCILYLGISIYTSVKIHSSILLSRRQKNTNIILNCLVPLLWYYLIRPVIFQPSKTITKAERERMIREESGSKLGDEIGSSQDARFL